MPEIMSQLKTALVDRYLIERQLGEGGMATVFLAHDVKHERKVALKVLKPELAAVIGAERFLAEIKVTANLQHPNILPLYDSGSAAGRQSGSPEYLYYVMPYVEGETLRDKLDREKQFGIEEAVELARSVAAALDYAHRHDVIHRDIKPANILLHDGQALVADFGIALAVSHAGGARLTETGLSIGTPHYMSPEQAMGDRELDARSDVYSLGAMLYEMLTGDPPYTGSTAQAIVAKVITEKAPPVTAARDTVPSSVATAIGKALNKLPADRFASAAQFAEALANPAFAGAAPVTAAAPAAEKGPKTWARRTFANWQLGVALVVGVALGAVVGALRGTASTDVTGPVARFTLGVRLGDVDFGQGLELSADGRQLIYIGVGENGGSQLYLRPMDEAEAIPIAGTEGSLVMVPFLSPDGGRLGFYADQQLRTVPVRGGAPRTIARMSPTSGGASWGPGSQIVFQPDFGAGLMVVEAEGGDPRLLTSVDSSAGELDHRWPHIVPNGKWVLFTLWRGSVASARIGAASLETGEVRDLLPGTDGRYVDAGYLVYAGPEGALRAVAFDAAKAEVQGIPITLVDSLLVGGDGAAQYALSRNGTLAFLSSLGSTVPVVMDRNGGKVTLPLEAGDYQAPRFSPDGRALAMQFQGEIWVYDFALGTFGPLTLGGGFYPLWTPDGRNILFSRSEGPDVNIYSITSDRAEEPVPVVKAPGQHRTQDLSPDGKHAMLRLNGVAAAPEAARATGSRGPSPSGSRLGLAGGQYDLFSLSLDSSGTPQPWLVSEFLERSPTFSPDGRWVAFSSDESGRDEVYVRPFPGPGGRIQVSTDGGTEPAWSPDGRELFYRSGDRFDVVSVQLGSSFRVLSRPRTLFEGRYYAYPWQREYDIHPDGDRFLIFQYEEEETELTVVVNWMAGELERLRGTESDER
jgi:serine/threonine-protein kinase